MTALPPRAMTLPLPATVNAVPVALPKGYTFTVRWVMKGEGGVKKEAERTPATLDAPVKEFEMVNVSCSTRIPNGEWLPVCPDTAVMVSLAFKMIV